MVRSDSETLKKKIADLQEEVRCPKAEFLLYLAIIQCNFQNSNFNYI